MAKTKRESKSKKVEKPYWDADEHELWFKGRVIKRYSREAKLQACILGAFQEEGWPPCIDDPLTGNAEQSLSRSSRFRNAVRKLNENVEQFGLGFKCNGRGGVWWYLAS